VKNLAACADGRKWSSTTSRLKNRIVLLADGHDENSLDFPLL